MPHSRTWSALFLASGHDSGVPTALRGDGQRGGPMSTQDCAEAGRAYSSPIMMTMAPMHQRVSWLEQEECPTMVRETFE